MNAVSSVACAIILLGCTIISAAEPREIALWPEGVPEPRVPAEPAEKSNVSNPRLVVYDIPRAEPAKLRSAVIVIPGGGFKILADEHEGSDICRWFNERGYVAFLLLHRVPTGTFESPNAGPVLDAQKAVHEVRRRAGEYHLDPQKIALLGFSAGGQTALVAAASPPRERLRQASAAWR